LSTIKRLHTAAVDAAFAHGHVETLAECEARELAGDCVREIALKLDAALAGGSSFLARVARITGHNDPDFRYALTLAGEANACDITARALLGALELALRSHGRFKAYVEAKRALEACEAPKDA
jgi:hypothetical protein